MRAVQPKAVGSQTPDATPLVETTTVGLSLYVEVAPGQYEPESDRSGFQIEPNTPLRFGVWLEPDFPAEAVDLRLFLLLDYRPLPFALAPMDPAGTPPAGGQVEVGPLQPSIDFTIPSGVERDFAAETAPVPAGYHDFALLVVSDPDASQIAVEYDTAFRSAMRLSVYAGTDARPPILSLDQLDPDATVETGFTDLAAFADQPDSNRMSGGSILRAGTTETVFLRLVPYPEPPMPPMSPPDGATPDPNAPLDAPVALVAFLGERVVPLNGESFLLGTLPEGRISTVEMEIPTPTQPGAEQFYVQVFPNPFADVDEAYAAGRSLFSVQPRRLTIERDSGS